MTRSAFTRVPVHTPAPPAPLDETYLAAERWALWRTLARGLAHGLANAAQMLTLDPIPPRARDEAVERVQNAIARLTEAYRAPEPGPTCVADVLASVQELQRLQSAFRSTELALDVAPGLPAVTLPEPDLAHVLLALVTRAKLAAGAERASIRVHARHADGAVEIELVHDGPQRTAATRERDFEPDACGPPGTEAGIGLHGSRLLARRAGGELGPLDSGVGDRLLLPAFRRPGAPIGPAGAAIENSP